MRSSASLNGSFNPPRRDAAEPQAIIGQSQLCTEELEAKTREKKALVRLLDDVKKKKLLLATRIAKKKREMDAATIQTIEIERKTQLLANQSRVSESELQGVKKENEKLGLEVEQLQRDLQAVQLTYEQELQQSEQLKKMVQSVRREIASETRQRDVVQHDLQASRTAQALMQERLAALEARNRALMTCVVDTLAA
mmetsp:Transcript_24325/g.58983  ORF Transcript_24325/g.58983 Transcript_24325/m.58983 type:complete len:196 (+) Transcript_24325:42-629(+)